MLLLALSCYYLKDIGDNNLYLNKLFSSIFRIILNNNKDINFTEYPINEKYIIKENINCKKNINDYVE